MAHLVLALAPTLLWKHFAALAALPRCSGNEAAVLESLKAFAAAQGLTWRQDARGNLVLRKPASPGREGRPTVVLQAHVDMVCEQNVGRGHDFSCDPLDLVVDGAWVRADGTTLGADNGIGAAAILAVLEDRTLVHGPLEALFTVEEETGLQGVLALDPTLITGRLLLNIDSEDDGRFTVGCAGGSTLEGEVPVSMSRTDAPAGWTVFLKGLAGGHSGVQIHRNLGNSLKLAARFAAGFLSAQPSGSWQLANLSGGDKHNAIPREALLTLAGPADGLARLQAAAADARALFAAELGAEGSGLELVVGQAPVPAQVLTPASQQLLLDVVAALPDGVQGMSKVVPGLVETSCNLAKVGVDDNRILTLCSCRSSQASLRELTAHRIESVIRLAGGTVVHSAPYPAWPPRTDSPLRREAEAVWTRLTGQPPVIELVHAGLECAVIGDKIPGMDMLSFGPTLQNIHSPQERVEIATVERCHRFVTELLKVL